MPSRSSVVWKRETLTYFVRPSPRSSSVTVSTQMWPGMPSHSNVWTIFSGGTSSRIVPRNACSP